jgi:hypothetical protein
MAHHLLLNWSFLTSLLTIVFLQSQQKHASLQKGVMTIKHGKTLHKLTLFFF